MNKICLFLTASILTLFLLSCKKNAPEKDPTDTELNKEFFAFEFKGTTYNLVNLLATKSPNGYIFQGMVQNTASLVTVGINTETSSATISIPFGDQDEAGKAVVLFNLPNQNDIYATTGYDCHGRLTYSTGQAKLTAIGNVGSYIEGNISGAAYYKENNCPDKGSVTLESFKGSFKILRKF